MNWFYDFMYERRKKKFLSRIKNVNPKYHYLRFEWETWARKCVLEPRPHHKLNNSDLNWLLFKLTCHAKIKRINS